ncbi:MAG: 30S ribosomal protein S6 [Bacillales bacterium]|nr:30S ribosomal protein S6 [Bacillales bacterium]
MRKYETMYVLKADLEEEARNKIIEDIHNILVTNGALNLAPSEWGKRQLAYPINFEKYGYYVVTNFELEEGSVALKEFTRLLNINPNVLRHIVVNKN